MSEAKHFLGGTTLTSCSCQGFIHGRIFYDASHTAVFGDVERQVTCDVVEVGLWVWLCQSSHRAFGGLQAVADEPRNYRFRVTAARETQEGCLISVCCLLTLQLWSTETGCNNRQELVHWSTKPERKCATPTLIGSLFKYSDSNLMQK